MPLSLNFGEENDPKLFSGKPKTPVTLISGFLGSGKTTLLKHLLENQENVRIGVVVNDVAAVNIDYQLVRRYERGGVEIAELQNGCVCCSSADDLFAAVQNIVMRSKDVPFEHIVVELSGVGEPEAVKRNWAIGFECGMPVALRTEIQRVVTVVDASSFGKDWLDTRKAQDRNEEVQGERHDEKNRARLESVGQLLAEQVEWADVVVLNKTDLATEEELQSTMAAVEALNGSAAVHHAVFGDISTQLVLPAVPRGLRLPESGKGEGYEWRQGPSELLVKMFIDQGVKGRDVDFKLGARSLRLGVRGRQAPRVEGRLFGELKNVDDVLFEIEGSCAERCVTLTLEKRSSGLWAGLWEADSKSSAQDSTSSEQGLCEVARPSSQVFAPRLAVDRAEARFGIHSFVYQRRRPFHASRLKELLQTWPLPGAETFRAEDMFAQAVSPEGIGSCLKPILRSKGFCWLESEPLRQHVWAHAGKTLVQTPGDWWWSALAGEQLEFKVTYPGVEAEYKTVREQKWDADVGDRRQELVFIGGRDMQESSIVPLLDRCLLSEEEFDAFRAKTFSVRVPDDEFQMAGLLKTLGASPEEIEADEKQGGQQRDELRKRRKEEREAEDKLRSLGVGSALEEEDTYEAVD